MKNPPTLEAICRGEVGSILNATTPELIRELGPRAPAAECP
jgi:hypothetical protein